MARFLIAVVLLATYVLSEAFLLDECRSDKDCGSTGCCLRGPIGNECHKFKARLQSCHLTSKNVCGCMPGLTCTKEEDLDIALEPSGYKDYGRCEKTKQNMTQTASMAPATASSPVPTF